MSRLIDPDKLNSFLKKAVGALSVYIIFYDVFGGLINFILINGHALFVNNLAGVFIILLLGAYFFVSAARLRTEKVMLFLLLLIGVYIVYATCNSMNFMQTVYGFYVWTPFFLGMLLCVYGRETAFFRYMPAFWLCTVIGLFLNVGIDFPWIGQSYEAHGVTVQAARKWNAYGGYDRLSGFARANYSAATVILISCCYFLTSKKYSGFVKLAVYAISCWAIFLTTSKTEVIAILLVPLVLYVSRVLRAVAPKTKLDFYFSRAMVWLMAVLVVALPLALSTHNTALTSGPSYMFMTADTMIERATWMWPGGFDMLEKDGNPILGRGVGGIGMPLSLNEKVDDSTSAADNLFVHVYVEMGLLITIPFFLAFFIGWRSLYDKDKEHFDLISLLAFCVLNIGITAGCVEDPLLALLLGFLVAKGYVSRKDNVIRNYSSPIPTTL